MKKQLPKNSLPLLLGLLFFLSGCGDPTGQKEYTKAVALSRRGELVRAQGEYKKAIRKLSQNAEKAKANNQLALILWQLGKKKEAIHHFQEACRLSNRVTTANKNLAIALFQSGKMASAKLEFRQILNETPQDATALFYLGLIQICGKDPSAAIPIFSKTRPSNIPETQTALALAEFHSTPSSDVALNRLKKVLFTFPNYLPAAYNLAVLYDQFLHQPKLAKKYYTYYLNKGGKTAPKTKTVEEALIQLQRKNSQTTVNSSEKNTTSYLAQGSRFYAARKYREATLQFQQALKIDPSSQTAYYNLGLSYYALKEYALATQAYINALERDPSFSDARYMLALTYCQQQRWADAQRETTILKKSDPKRAATLQKYITSLQNR